MKNNQRPTIPENFPSSPLEAARFYRSQGFIPFPINRPNEGTEKEKGKKPKIKGYRSLKPSDITEEYLTLHWGMENPPGVGCILSGNHIVFDLDAKNDEGESARKYLQENELLNSLPRERTANGYHLHCLCPDHPRKDNHGKIRKSPLSKSLSEGLVAEVMSEGMPITVAPSQHKSGRVYHWEVTGALPEITWDRLSKIFGFSSVSKRKPGRPRKEKPWWSKWKQDLRTLQLVTALKKIEVLGECLDSETGKYAVRCPWESEHSGPPSEAPESDTVIFTKENTLPSFKCLHAHCTDRTIVDFLELIEERQPGIIAEHCTEDRVWSPNSKAVNGRKKVLLPAPGRSFSQFAAELGKVAGSEFDLLRRGREVVEVSKISHGVERSEASLASLNPRSLVTAVERKAEVGTLKSDAAGDSTFVVKSMTESQARLLRECGPFLDSLPVIDRTLQAPIPRKIEGLLVYPIPGYDPASRTWMAPKAPRLHSMSVDEALNLLLGELLCGSEFGGFCWRDDQAQLHALARLVTPFIRGLINWDRGPIWIFAGNREGCGKDTCADLTHILYTGSSVIGAPLSKGSDDELRKRITSALKCVRQFFHLANLKGFLNYPSLEAATDGSCVWEDRLLNVNEVATLRNEMEFSISSNNAKWTPDLERRCRQIQLHVPNECLNDILFRHQDIRAYVLENRAMILSAINALVVKWVSDGCPDGRTRFNAFPSWGRVIGGIFASCGLADPCLPHPESESAGDHETAGMRLLYQASFEKFGEKPVEKDRFLSFVKSQPTILDKFDWIDLTEQGGKIKFGRLMAKYEGRQLRDVTMTIEVSSKNHKSYRFRKSSLGGSWGSEPYASSEAEIIPSVRVSGPLSDNTKALHPYGRTSPTSLSPAIKVTNLADLREINNCFTKDAPLSCFLQTEDLASGEASTPEEGDHHTLVLYQEGAPVFAIDLTLLRYDLIPIEPLLRSAVVISYEGKELVSFLQERCGVALPTIRCLHTGHQLLTAGENSLCILETLVGEFKLEQTLHNPSEGDQRIGIYAAPGIVNLLTLDEFLCQEIGEAHLKEIWELENSIIPVTVRMEQNGLPFDRALLLRLADSATPGADTLFNHLDSDDRVRATFKPLGTQTGRFSCCTPNLQGIPRGPIRKSIHAPAGRIFIIADYCHIELRIAASIAKAKTMILAFESGKDIHTITASQILEIPVKEIDSDQRCLGKALNFGLIYGQTPKGIQKSASKKFGVDITLSEAARFLRRFFAAYPEFQTWHEACKTAAKTGVKESRTLLGRRRLLPDDIEEWKRTNALVNSPIQGTMADGLKRSLLLLDEKLSEDAKLVSVIHDEVIIEVAQDSAERTQRLLDTCLTSGMASIVKGVPIAVESRISKTWAE